MAGRIRENGLGRLAGGNAASHALERAGERVDRGRLHGVNPRKRPPPVL
jgi:hypothetical protein